MHEMESRLGDGDIILQLWGRGKEGLMADRGQGEAASHGQPACFWGASRPGWVYTSISRASNHVLQAYEKLLAGKQYGT